MNYSLHPLILQQTVIPDSTVITPIWGEPKHKPDITKETLEKRVTMAQEYMYKTYPKLFNDIPLPLAIGTTQQILRRDRPPNIYSIAIKTFLRRYTSSVPYLTECVKPGAMRYTLTGEPDEPVSRIDREYMLITLTNRLTGV